MTLIRKGLLTLALLLGLALPASAQALSGTTCPGAGCAEYIVGGNGTVGIGVAGTFVGTLTASRSINGVNWFDLPLTSQAGGSTVSTITTTGAWTGPVAGYFRVRIAFTAYTSGTANVSELSALSAGSVGGGGGSGAPVDATYLTQTPNGTLTNEQALSGLASGILRVATTTGVVTSLGDNLPVANLNGGTGASASTFWRGDGTWAAAGGGSAPGDITLPSNVLGGGAAGAYTYTNSGFVFKNGVGDEILRFWASDPDSDNYNSQNLYIGFTAGGSQPADNDSAGYGNLGIGDGALTSSTTGYHNSGAGLSAIESLIDGYDNSGFGWNTLRNVVHGNSNTAVGKDNGPTGDFSNTFAFGVGAMPSANNRGVLGNNSVTDTYVGGEEAASNVHAATFLPTVGYKSVDGTVGATVTVCTGFKNGLCISGT